MENTTTHQVSIPLRLNLAGLSTNDGVTFWFPSPGAVLVFLPGLAEIKMLYEQLMSNRMFNNRGATRSVSCSLVATSVVVSVHEGEDSEECLFSSRL